MATKEDLRRATFSRFAGLCNKVAECPDANSETAKKALELRTELLAFSRWLAPGKTAKQIETEENSLTELVRLISSTLSRCIGLDASGTGKMPKPATETDSGIRVCHVRRITNYDDANSGLSCHRPLFKVLCRRHVVLRPKAKSGGHFGS